MPPALMVRAMCYLLKASGRREISKECFELDSPGTACGQTLKQQHFKLSKSPRLTTDLFVIEFHLPED